QRVEEQPVVDAVDAAGGGGAGRGAPGRGGPGGGGGEAQNRGGGERPRAVAGVTGSRLRWMPSRGRGSTARMAWTARPWATSRWWAARTAVAGSRRPGAGVAGAGPRKGAHQRLLGVVQLTTRSARAP